MLPKYIHNSGFCYKLQITLCFVILSEATSFIQGFYCFGYSQCFAQSENVLETVFSPRKNSNYQPLAVSFILSDPVSQRCASQRWFVCLYGFFSAEEYVAEKSRRFCHFCCSSVFPGFFFFSGLFYNCVSLSKLRNLILRVSSTYEIDSTRRKY